MAQWFFSDNSPCTINSWYGSWSHLLLLLLLLLLKSLCPVSCNSRQCFLDRYQVSEGYRFDSRGEKQTHFFPSFHVTFLTKSELVVILLDFPALGACCHVCFAYWLVHWKFASTVTGQMWSVKVVLRPEKQFSFFFGFQTMLTKH